MPKKLGARVAVADGGEVEQEAWGLHVHEVLCWKKTSIAFALIGAAALAFAIVWCKVRNGSVQDGFTVTGVILAYSTILVGLLQIVVFQQSVRAS